MSMSYNFTRFFCTHSHTSLLPPAHANNSMLIVETKPSLPLDTEDEMKMYRLSREFFRPQNKQNVPAAVHPLCVSLCGKKLFIFPYLLAASVPHSYAKRYVCVKVQTMQRFSAYHWSTTDTSVLRLHS
jgi:hypothetical protein